MRALARLGGVLHRELANAERGTAVCSRSLAPTVRGHYDVAHIGGSEAVAVVSAPDRWHTAASRDDLAVDPAPEAGREECQRVIGTLAPGGPQGATHVLLTPPLDQGSNRVRAHAPVETS